MQKVLNFLCRLSLELHPDEAAVFGSLPRLFLQSCNRDAVILHIREFMSIFTRDSGGVPLKSIMKIRLLLSLTLLLSAALPAGTQPAENLGKQLRELDRVIANREVYAARREGQFEEIKYRLAHGNLSSEERFCDYGRLFNEYLSYQVDTAIHYALLKK